MNIELPEREGGERSCGWEGGTVGSPLPATETVRNSRKGSLMKNQPLRAFRAPPGARDRFRARRGGQDICCYEKHAPKDLYQSGAWGGRWERMARPPGGSGRNTQPMTRTLLPAVLPIILLLFAEGAAAAPWADAVPAGHWMAPLDAFEENLSISLAEARVQASGSGAERQAALRDWRTLLDALSAERSAERSVLEARYASGSFTPAQFNRAMEQLQERARWLEGASGPLALAEIAAATSPAPPPPVSNLTNTTYESYRLNWSWTEPRAPYNRTEVYVNGMFIYSLPRGVAQFGLARTSPGTEHTLSLRVVDSPGSASPWTNHTARTAPNPPPGNITNLTVANRSQGHIHWNWTNPPDADYNHTEVWLNGTLAATTRLPDYNRIGLSPGTRVSLYLRAVDWSGQAGPWANTTSETLALPAPPSGGFFTPAPTPTPTPSPSCPRCEDVDCESCNNGICYEWEVHQGEGKQKFTCG